MMRRVAYTWLCLITSATLAYGSVSVSQNITPKIATVGDLLSYELTIVSSLNTQVSPPDLAELLPPFTIVSQDLTSAEAQGLRTIQLSAILAMYESGSYIIPTASVLYTEGSAVPSFNPSPKETEESALSSTALAGPLPVHIKSVLSSSKNVTQAMDFTAPFSLSIQWWPYIAGLLFIIGLILSVGVLYKKYVKKPMMPVIEADQAPQKTPWETIIEELTIIENTKIRTRDQIKPLYFRLTDALKQYFSSIFQVPFLEKTTSEVLSDLESLVDEQTLRRIRHVFEQADMIKYTTTLPTKTDHFGLIKRAKDVANRLTKIAEEDRS